MGNIASQEQTKTGRFRPPLEETPDFARRQKQPVGGQAQQLVPMMIVDPTVLNANKGSVGGTQRLTVVDFAPVW